MNKVWIVIRKEYLERVRSVGFIIATVLIPVLLSSFVIVPVAIQFFTAKSDSRIAVIDQTGKLQRYIFDALDSSSNIKLVVANFADENERQVLIKDTDAGKLTGYIIVKQDSAGKYIATYTSRTVTDFTLNSTLARALRNAVNRFTLKEKGFADAEITAIERPIDFQTQKLSGEKEKNDSGLSQYLLSIVMVMLIYGTMLSYGAFVMMSVIEEKSSKVMEVVISSVKPFDLMLGKIIGIGLVALTQYAIWIVVSLAFSGASFRASSTAQVSFDIAPHLLVYFVVYFVLGYLIYSTLYAAVGSAFESQQDAQSLTTPITLLVIVPMVTLQLVLNKPDAPISVALSMVPFFAPILMMARTASTEVPFWQVAISWALMIGTFYLVLLLGSKIYRIGVLMYGKKPSLAEIVKWVRYS